MREEGATVLRVDRLCSYMLDKNASYTTLWGLCCTIAMIPLAIPGRGNSTL